MRIRTIKPEFWQSEKMSRVSREARLLFVGLWSMADDSGRTRAASRLLASTLYPYDEDAPSLISGWLEELVGIGCIRLYEVDACHYLDIPKWLDHQKIDKPSKSKFPSFDESSRAVDEPSRKIALDQGTGKGTGNREQGGAPENENQNPPGEVADQDRWPYERREPWAQALCRVGAKIGPNNWPVWKGLTERFPLADIVAHIPTVPACDRWPDKVEQAMQPPAVGHKESARGIRNQFASHLKWISIEAVSEKIEEYGEEGLQAVLGVAQTHDIVFDAEEWREAFEGRKSAYGGWDFWKPQKRLAQVAQ